MTKQAKLWMMFGIAGILLISACQKGADILVPPTKKELLTDGSWLYSAHTIEPGVEENGVFVTDFYLQKDPCERDDVLSFTSTQTFTWDEGDTICGVDQIIDMGTWVFRENQDNIFLDYSDPANPDIEFVFEKLNRDELILLYNYSDSINNYQERIISTKFQCILTLLEFGASYVVYDFGFWNFPILVLLCI